MQSSAERSPTFSASAAANRYREAKKEPLDHAIAWYAPRAGFERAIVEGTKAWIEYADQHHRAYGEFVGSDYCIAEHWVAWGESIIGLLNGEVGRLDCGCIDGLIRCVALSQGVELT